MERVNIFILTLGILFLNSCTDGASKQFEKVKHVVVIGFDGLSPDGLANSETPNFDKVMNEGSYTMHARGVLPTTSSTNWATAMKGAGPEQHGITSNTWKKNSSALPPVTQSEDLVFPTIFHLVNSQIENAEIGAIYQWEGIGTLFEKSAVDYDINPTTEEETAKLAIEYIKNKNPNFTFIHFLHVDHDGHSYGHGSKKYYEAVEKADKLLGQVMDAIKESEMGDDTVVIIAADHGGKERDHGGESLAEIEVPFIVWGKSVNKNNKIMHPVYQYDNAATVAFALGLKRPMAWIGKPVLNAFKGFEKKVNYPITERLKEPVILPAGGAYTRAGGLANDQMEVTIQNPNKVGVIRYTLDGKMPTIDSKIYKVPFKVTETTTVKSAIFLNEKISSTIYDAYFRIKKKSDKAPIEYEIYYMDKIGKVPSLKNKTPNAKGSVFEITSDEVHKKVKRHTAVLFKTQIVITKEDVYTFYLRSDDGSKMWVNGKEVVNNDGNHEVKEAYGSIVLKPGIYPLEVNWFNGGGSFWMDAYYESPDIPKQIISTAVLKPQ